MLEGSVWRLGALPCTRRRTRFRKGAVALNVSSVASSLSQLLVDGSVVGLPESVGPLRISYM